jgi:hypothetical protein
MKSFLKKNKVAYLILFFLLGAFVVLFTKAWPNKELQRYIAAIFGIAYFFWGIITHLKSKKINQEIVFEYLAITMLATLIIILITL